MAPRFNKGVIHVALSVQCLGENRGIPRLWLRGGCSRWPGLRPAWPSVALGERRLHLRASSSGKRVVSARRRANRTLSVIDVNSRCLLRPLSAFRTLRIVVLGPGEDAGHAHRL